MRYIHIGEGRRELREGKEERVEGGKGMVLSSINIYNKAVSNKTQ